MNSAAPVAAAYRHLLICLPNQRTQAVLNEVLTTAGFSVTSTSDIVQFKEALRLGGYSAVVTVALLIEPIQALCDLPLVDIQPFSRSWARPRSQPYADNFAAAAFLKRLRLITENLVSNSADRSDICLTGGA